MEIIAYCDNPNHKRRERLKVINEILETRLDTEKPKTVMLHCEECNKLFYISGPFLVPIGQYDHLIANIDSPANNSIKCECGGNACYAGPCSWNAKYYWCPDCKKLYYYNPETDDEIKNT